MNRVTRALMALSLSCVLPLFAPGAASAGCITPATKIIFAPQACQAEVTAETPTSEAVAEVAERKGEKTATEEKTPVQREAAPAPRMAAARPAGRAR